MLTDALYQAKQWTDEDRSLAKYIVFFEGEGGGRFDSAAGEKNILFYLFWWEGCFF